MARPSSATPFPVTEILKKHETEFFSVVNARLRLLWLRRQQVITQDIMALINAATNDENAQDILYNHLTEHANMDSLLKYCEVIIAAEGYPRMQSLGMKMKEDLQCMQGESSRKKEREWQSAYQESLRKHGSVSVEVIRTIFIGPTESGKSTLKHLLVHNKPKAVDTSTDVMATPEVVTRRPMSEVTKQTDKHFSSEQYVVGESTSAWQLVDSDVMKKALHACIAHQAYKKKDRYPAKVEVEGIGQHEVEQMDDSPPPDGQSDNEWDQSDVALLDRQFSQLLKEIEAEGNHLESKEGEKGKRIQLTDAFFMHLLDTGGQPSFQDVLPLLLEVPCTYVQVFNAALSLDERVPNSYRSNDHTRVCLKEGGELGRDIMLRSFSSMQTMAHKRSKQLASFLQEGSSEPQLRIFAVGTHKDQLLKEGRLGEATQHITAFLDGLEGKPYYHSIEWDSSAGRPFFLVNAMAGKEDRASVNSLRKCLSSEGSPLKLDVPVMWFICQEVTRRCTEKKFFRLQDLETFCRKHNFIDGENAASQFRALLQLFSHLGFYSFFTLKGVPDKDNFVCTDTGAFLKEVSKLLAVQFTDTTKSGPMKNFKKYGILANTPQLFKGLKMNPAIDRKWFLEALQHLGIAARLHCVDQPEYLIPAALPQTSAVLHPKCSVEPLCFTYEMKEGLSLFYDMPRGVFCRLAVELIQNEWRILKDECTRSLLKLREPRKQFDIFLEDCAGYISIIPRVLVKFFTPEELHTACESLHCDVTRCLLESTMNVIGSEFSNSAKLITGFKCLCKKAKDVCHLAIPVAHGDFLKCSLTKDRQKYTTKQHIWFSSVEDVELKQCSDPDDPDKRGIWVLEECTTTHNATLVQVIQDHAEQFLEEMNSKVLAHPLKALGLIPAVVENNVLQSRSRENANAHLLQHLKEDADMKSVIEVFRIASQEPGYRKMNTFADGVLRKLQQEIGKEKEKEAEEKKDKSSSRKEREWQSAYQESLGKHGSVSVEVKRTILIGPPDSGKSTLKYLLVHNKPKASQTSTGVIDTPEVVISSEQYVMGESTSNWQLVDSDIMKKALHECIANQAYEEKDQYPAGVETKGTGDGQHDAAGVEAKRTGDGQLEAAGVEAKGTGDGQHEAAEEDQRDGSTLPEPKKVTPEQDQSDMALLYQHYFQLQQEMREGGKHFTLRGASFIHLLDTGGQPSFQGVLPLLLKVPCTYVQVFNAALGLDERVPISYRPDNHTRLWSDGKEKARDMMLRSFSSIHTMAHKISRELATFQQEKDQLPQLRIFVVGTHKDEIEEDRLDEATKKITAFLDGLQDKPYYRSIKWDSSAGQPFFLVNALAGKEDRASVDHLRKCLSSEGSPLKLDVPVSWFIFHEITRHCTEKKFFRLQDLEAFCLKHEFIDGENAASQFRALLQLFSLLGFYSFFNLEGVPDKDNFVCTDTGVFLKEVSKLLAVQFAGTKSREINHFQNHGILADIPELFKDLKMNLEMNPKWFLEALQHLGIAARLPCEDLQYIIPAALPRKPAERCLKASVEPLCFTYEMMDGIFQVYDMPRGVFCRFAVELIQNDWDIFKDECSRSLLKIQEPQQQFNIFLEDCTGYISIIPQALVEFSSLKELHTACKSLCHDVERCLSNSTANVVGSDFNSRAKLKKGFKCLCKKEDGCHLAIPAKHGQFLKCSSTQKDLPGYTKRHHIWFSSVESAELKRLPDPDNPDNIGIWVLEERTTTRNADSPLNDDSILSQRVHDRPDHIMLFRVHVSRKAAGKARAVLEGVGLDQPTINACETAHPLNDEEAVQDGLIRWNCTAGH